ncbi:hypothetical protein [Vibrio splendidus]|uniref:hypothetical protein n=1 Tax=Vibrio splendidus TaxID=29497 RepID=UPI0011B1F59A|nr:hypothetical protein [Vibrio splendidus]
MKLHENGVKYQSARAALYSYLCSSKPRALYLPNYLCDSILPLINALNIPIKWYEVDSTLLPTLKPNVAKGELFLIVNYFGLISNQIQNIVSSSPEQFIVDNSQALFSEYIYGTTTIYSPRKFLAIPDGGFLYTKNKLDEPKETYDAEKHVSHLILRAAGDVSTGYKYFLEAERSLEHYHPKKMSIISEYLIRCSDLCFIKRKRCEHYERLYNHFKDINLLDLPRDGNVPLCYPLHLNINVENIHKNLISKSIYLPRYWKSDFSCKHGEKFYQRTLFLPVDERISDDQMLSLISEIKSELATF